jgi:hypothetical protein
MLPDLVRLNVGFLNWRECEVRMGVVNVCLLM